MRTLERIAAILEAVDPRARGLDLGQLEPVPAGDVADPLDRLALQARWAAERLGIAPGDSPLLRPLRDDERRICGGRATSIEEAKQWLAPLVAHRPEAFRTSYLERIAPALLPLSAQHACFAATEAHRRLFGFTEARCPDARYAALQEQLLNYRNLILLAQRDRAAELVSPEKYLHAPVYTVSKLAIAQRLGLHQRGPIAVLDLGAGPAHFGLASAFLGHDFLGLDVPYESALGFGDHDLYGELFACFGLERSLQRISPFTPLVVPRRFELVTCLMGTFCTHRTDTGAVPWQWPEWQFFLRDLVEHVVTPRFELYLNINRPYFPAAVTDALRALGAEVDLERCVARITHQQAEAILR